MHAKHSLEFKCQSCEKEVPFSLFDIDIKTTIACSNCSKKYTFSDENLIRQLKKFEALCLQIRESEEILGNTSFGVDVGEKSVKIPFKLLLTRLTSCLDLRIGDKPLSISFRFEPLHDSPKKSIT